MSEEYTRADLSALDFALQCARYLEQKGYDAKPVSTGIRHTGVDVVAEKYGIKYAIRCECENDRQIESDAVRQAAAGRKEYRCDAAVVMTNTTFTDSATELAKASDVILWPSQNVESASPDSREYGRVSSVSRSRDDLISFQKKRGNSSFRRSLLWLLVAAAALAVLLIVLFRVPAMQGHNVLEGLISNLRTE